MIQIIALTLLIMCDPAMAAGTGMTKKDSGVVLAITINKSNMPEHIKMKEYVIDARLYKFNGPLLGELWKKQYDEMIPSVIQKVDNPNLNDVQKRQRTLLIAVLEEYNLSLGDKRPLKDVPSEVIRQRISDAYVKDIAGLPVYTNFIEKDLLFYLDIIKSSKSTQATNKAEKKDKPIIMLHEYQIKHRGELSPELEREFINDNINCALIIQHARTTTPNGFEGENEQNNKENYANAHKEKCEKGKKISFPYSTECRYVAQLEASEPLYAVSISNVKSKLPQLHISYYEYDENASSDFGLI